MRCWLIRGLAFVLMAVPALAAPLPHEAYIWQRLWTADVRAAVADGKPLFAGWRVLAAETDRRGTLKAFAVDWKALQGKPVTAVVRIDGALARFDAKALLGALRTLVAGWPRGVALEIDYDCGTASLAAYAAFLHDVRALGPARLSVTALPAWLLSPDLDAVLTASDEAVLQVHAVQNPSQGLFDAKLARRWIDAMDRGGHPFRVALPDYGTRVIRSEGGSVIALESETPKLTGGASAEELNAAPGDVAALLADLARRPPRHLAGIVWFRLPVKGDKRIWSRDTLAAVVQGKPLTPRIDIALQPGPAAGSQDVVVINTGDADAPSPRLIRLAAACSLADGVAGYRFDAEKNAFVRLQNVLLAAHHARVIGWVRCNARRGDLDVEP